MPTELSAARAAAAAAAARRLSWPDTVRLLFLLVQVGLLNLRSYAGFWVTEGVRRRGDLGGR